METKHILPGVIIIPEELEAEIKDGKIIVRKKESEDETIRKNIISFLESHVPDSPTSCIGKTQMINWLERQKEKQPAEKQDYSGLNDLERAILRGFLAAGIENVPVGIIQDTASECIGFLALLDDKPAEWTDADEKILERIINRQKFIIPAPAKDPLVVLCSCAVKTPRQSNWLKRRVASRPQPKQERSEEDERVRTQLLDFLENLHSQGATMNFEVWSKADCANWIAYLEKQKFHTEGDFGRGYDCGYQACLNSHGAEWFEKQKELNPELLKELNKGFKQAIMWGREGYEVSPDGKVRALNQDEIDEVEGKIKGSLHIHESCKDNADSLTDENEHQCDCEHVGCHINNCRRWCKKFNNEVPYEFCDPTCRGYSHKNTGGISVMKPTWTGNDSMALVSLKAIINNSNHDEARKKELLDWIDGRLGPQDGELMWLFAKAGTKFPADALVFGTGEDKDPRIVRCAVNDCYYLVVSDILPPKSVTDKLGAQYGESHGEPAPGGIKSDQ